VAAAQATPISATTNVAAARPVAAPLARWLGISDIVLLSVSDTVRQSSLPHGLSVLRSWVLSGDSADLRYLPDCVVRHAGGSLTEERPLRPGSHRGRGHRPDTPAHRVVPAHAGGEWMPAMPV